MILFMHLAELSIGEVGVDLGGSDRAVAEEFLDGADVGSVYQ